MEFLRIPATSLLLFTRMVAHSNKAVWLLVTLAALLWVQNAGLLALGTVVIHIIRSYTNDIMAFFNNMLCNQP